MQANKLISKHECCEYYHVEVSFLDTLHEYGLIEMRSVEGTHFLQEEQLQVLERFIRLHYDLNINMEGLDVIGNLLSKMQNMQDEIHALKTHLHIYVSSE